MLHKFNIARGEASLGMLTEAEITELLGAGFLLPTDLYWTAGRPDWEPLAGFKPEPHDTKSPAALIELAKQQARIASAKTVSQAARLVGKLKSVTWERGFTFGDFRKPNACRVYAANSETRLQSTGETLRCTRSSRGTR